MSETRTGDPGDPGDPGGPGGPGAPRVAIVKSAGRADSFALAVREAGCVPVLVSPYRPEVLLGAPEALRAALAAGPRWVTVTSPNAVPALEPFLSELRGLGVAAVGAGTATALRATGIHADVVGDSGGESLARRLVAAGLGAGDVVLHPCAEEARPELRRVVEDAGATVVAVAVYRMVPDEVGERAASGEFAAVVVGSPRLAARARHLFPSLPPAIAIGRTTASALRDLGWSPAAVAAQPSPEDVIAALTGVLGS